MREKGLVEFLDALADRSPTPGGGSAAALTGALGAALGLMALRFSKLEDSSPFESRLEQIRARMTRLIDEDAAAYEQVSQAYKLPKSTDAEKQARTRAIQDASRSAAQAPLEGMRQAVDGLTVVKALAPQCNKNLITDLASSVILLHAAGIMFGLNVDINVAALKEPRDLGGESSRLRAALGALKSETERLYEV